MARAIAAIVFVTSGLLGCTTAQLQKQYATFDTCFREQKIVATLGGALIGGVVGGLVGGGRRKQGAAVTAAGVAVGALIGHRVAWQSCLQAFPPKMQTTVIAPRPTQVPVAEPSLGAPDEVARGLEIQRITAQPLDFGRDLEASAEYVFVSDKPDARDVKARVSRNLLFTGPDGSKQEIASSSEDTIQQGTNRTTFAIPTPSAQDAPELLRTRDWAIKFVVEADGMRHEQVIPLQVPALQQVSQSAGGQPQQQVAQQQQQRQPQPSPSAIAADVQLTVPAGGVLMEAPNSNQVIARTKQAVSAQVLQWIVIRGVNWVQVEIPGGIRGWVRRASK